MAWICKNCGHVNVDASYKCMQCSAKRPEEVTKKMTQEKEEQIKN